MFSGDAGAKKVRGKFDQNKLHMISTGRLVNHSVIAEKLWSRILRPASPIGILLGDSWVEIVF